MAHNSVFSNGRFASMKHIAVFIALPALFVACSKAPETAPSAAQTQSNAVAHTSSIEWVKPDGASLDAVFAKAKADNKPVFLYWGAVWCPPCNQIKATVFNRPDFVAGSKAFIPVYLDGDTPGAQKLGTQFKVRGYPTTILFKPDGTELTRLPGEVDAAQFMQVLKLGLASTQPIKETLLAAMAEPAGGQSLLSADAWRLLAFYSWDTDEAQLLPKSELVPTLMQLAKKCPTQYEEAATRLGLRALVLAAGDKAASVDKIAGQAMLLKILGDEARARQNADILAYYTNELVNGLTTAGSPERTQLVTALNTALDRLSGTRLCPRPINWVPCRQKWGWPRSKRPRTPSPRGPLIWWRRHKPLPSRQTRRRPIGMNAKRSFRLLRIS
jgi:thioredoxin-related protein